jgi:hypothetical protein
VSRKEKPRSALERAIGIDSDPGGTATIGAPEPRGR